MNNILSRFYFLSKLSTSLILLLSLLFLGYLFVRAYFADNSKSEVVFNITEELQILSDSVEKNSTNLKLIEDVIIKNENSFNKLTSAINDLKKNKSNDELLIQIKKLFKKNDMMNNEIVYLSKKINSINNKNNIFPKNGNNSFSANNLINLISLKLESGINVNDEVQLLHNFDYSEEKMAYVEKLKILSSKDFIGLNKLNKNFEKASSAYLNAYYLLNNNNMFIKYLTNIVTIEPNYNGDIQDETIRLLASARTKLYEKDLENALKNLLLVKDNENFFEQWINEVSYFIEFDKTLNKLLQ